MNSVFFAMVLMAFLTAAWHQLQWDPTSETSSPMEVLSKGVIDAAAGSVDLAIGLIGVMALFLGLMKVAEAGGLLVILAKLIRPLMVRLFPDVPPNHPAMGAMVLNMSANGLGLGNAATPFGIRAMQELDKLNPHKGTATNAMALFLAINTSGVTLLPTGIIALRAAAGSEDPAGILPTTLFATLCSTAAAIMAAKLYCRFFPVNGGVPADFAPPTNHSEEHGNASTTTASQPDAESAPPVNPSEQPADTAEEERLDDHGSYPGWVSALALLTLLSLVPITLIWGRTIAPWIIPTLIISFLTFGLLRGVRIYEVFVEGAKDGFQVAIKIIPYLVAILVAVGMLRASGALEWLVRSLSVITAPLGLPAEALPMALLRPLSGSGAYGVVASIINDPDIGPDSYVGYLVSTLQGSTETTFYVLAVYFGAIQVRRIRHALAAALTADIVAVIAAVAICSWLFL